jgi:hypothetical protein
MSNLTAWMTWKIGGPLIAWWRYAGPLTIGIVLGLALGWAIWG